MEKMLSLCISTYNRAEYLDELLHSIFEQIRDVPAEKLELCINDDSADDKARFVVEKYREQNLVDLKYHRNHANTGMDKAFLSVVEMSSGKYCWILSDDDLMVPGALKKVFETILCDKYDLVITDKNYFDITNDIFIEKMEHLQDGEFNNASEYDKILSLGFWTSTYISSLIFNRDLWFHEEFDDNKLQIYKYFIHMRKIYSAIPYSGKLTKFLAFPTMAARASGYSYTKNFLRVWYFYMFNIIESLDLYKKATLETCKKETLSRNVNLLLHTNLLKNKIKNNLNEKYDLNFKIYKEIRQNISKKERLNCIIAILLPKKVIRSLLQPDYRFEEGFYQLLIEYRVISIIGYIFLHYINKWKRHIDRTEIRRKRLIERSNRFDQRNYSMKNGPELNRPIANRKDVEKIRVAMVTTWNSKCGIAEYSKMLCSELDDRIDFTIYPNYGVPLITEDEDNVACRCWQSSSEGDMKQLIHELKYNFHGDIIHLQVNAGFFNYCELARFIEELHGLKKIVLTLHKVKDIVLPDRTISLKSIKDQLNSCHRLIVFQKADVELLIDMGVNSEIIAVVPIGQGKFPIRNRSDVSNKLHIRNRLVLGSYGFLLPPKGIIEGIEAVAIVKKYIPDVLYLVCCSLYDNPISESYYQQCKTIVHDKGLSRNVVFITDYLSNEQSVTILQACNILLMNYKPSEEPASGAIRLCVAAMRPIMTTRQDVFAEYSDCTYQIDSCSPKLIADGILKLKDDIDLQKKLVENMKSVVENTSWTKVSEMFEKIYKAPPNKRTGEQSDELL